MVREAREEGMHASMVECQRGIGMIKAKQKGRGALIRESSHGL